MTPTPLYLALFGGIGGGEVILVLIIVLLLFGGERMPELARSLGKTLREIKKATSGVEDEIKRALAEPPPAKNTIKPVSPEVAALPPPSPEKPTEPTQELPPRS